MNEAPAADASARGTDRRERRVLILVLSFAIPVAVAVWLCLPNAGPVFRTFIIPSGSMTPTLPIGSHIVVSRASYGYSRFSFDSLELPIAGRWPSLAPQRGDVVVFRRSRDGQRFFQVNRVVGLPGDRIQMIDGRLSINGRLVPREPAPKMRDPLDSKAEVHVYIERLPEGASYRIIESQGDTGAFDNTPEFVVSQGHLFVLGDNRDNSVDSRDQSRFGVGFVPVELVIGRVIATF